MEIISRNAERELWKYFLVELKANISRADVRTPGVFKIRESRKRQLIRRKESAFPHVHEDEVEDTIEAVAADLDSVLAKVVPPEGSV